MAMLIEISRGDDPKQRSIFDNLKNALGFHGAHELRAWVLNIRNLCHGGSLGFDQEFDGELVVVVIPHGIQQGLRHLKWI